MQLNYDVPEYIRICEKGFKIEDKKKEDYSSISKAITAWEDKEEYKVIGNSEDILDEISSLIGNINVEEVEEPEGEILREEAVEVLEEVPSEEESLLIDLGDIKSSSVGVRV